jgi:hypothetical protein
MAGGCSERLREQQPEVAKTLGRFDNGLLGRTRPKTQLPFRAIVMDDQRRQLVAGRLLGRNTLRERAESCAKRLRHRRHPVLTSP